MTARSRRRSVERWEQFWFAMIPAHIFALLRIVFGALGCFAILSLSDLKTFWDVDGLVASTPWEDVKSFLAAHGLGRVAGRTLYAASLVSFFAMTIGYRSGVAVALSFAAAVVQLSWNFLPLSGANLVMVGVLFCLLWADCGAVWSLDARSARGGRGDAGDVPTFPIAPLRLIRFQVAIIYVNTGLWKLFSPVWRDGSAVHYVLNQNVFRRFSAQDMPPALDWMTTVGTYTTLAWEIAFPVMILFRPTRLLALALGIVLHLGMLFSIDVGIFSLVMLASYLAFLDPHAVPGMGSLLSRRPLLRRRAGSAASP